MLVIATLAGWIVWPSWPGLLATLAALTGAALLTTALTTLLSITSFWTLSGQGVSGLVSAMMFLFSGMIVPLPLFPDWSQPILTALPFRGLIDAPFRLFTGHMAAGELLPAMAHQAAWTVGLIVGGRALLRRGLRRVVVQGG
ncbi:MAG: ABC-2 family transporter protein [Planctomycetota bacterium]|jgi:ABC-2 type transport system permease protein